MKRILNTKPLVVITFCIGLFTSNLAQAITYTVNETFQGTWTAIWGLPISNFTHEATTQSLASGDASLFSDSISSAQIIFDINTCTSCTSTQNLKNGDKIFATSNFASGGGFSPNASNTSLIDNFYNGTITITGGTGLFEGATGSGSYNAIDFGIMNTDLEGNFVSFNPSGEWFYAQTLTINISAVPEPETYAMLIIGLSLIGIASRRKKNKQV